ncbi:HTH domain-containing protein [Sulfurovum sp. XGS-02]|uniref:MarR family winged helix-turn-helix transcriptional regulator n=1 Tax=Sulfurovum sp. XGS-02 TaxID=2925411 RepID=UPI00206E43C5|nr:HTH domain-containing protein [Sulfurovum sp. XGS-02]UPT77850.1 HTH domain-containing protein [Sulfurovum sp. XGS-02]
MSLCFLSLETSKVFNKLILEYLTSNGFDGLSDALIVLFPYLDEYEKLTASQLSKKVGYTRQAMHKNIKKLEEFGYITLVQENQKEKIIQLTRKSEKLIITANQYISHIENELSIQIGKKELEIYKDNQAKIYEYLNSISNS